MSNSTKKTTIDELVLLKLLKDRNEAGFDILYANYSNVIYGIIIRMLRDEDESKDLLQEAFIKIWNKIESYDSRKGKLFTWMANLTRNLVIDRIRSADYKNHVLKNFVRDDKVSKVDAMYQSNQQVDSIGLKGLILKLKPNHQILIQKIYFEGYTQADLAEELEIPLGTLKTRVRAAMLTLRKNFD